MDPISSFLLNNRHRQEEPLAEVAGSTVSSSFSSTLRTSDCSFLQGVHARNHSIDCAIPSSPHPPVPISSGQDRRMPGYSTANNHHYSSGIDSTHPAMNAKPHPIGKAVADGVDKPGWDIFSLLPPQPDRMGKEGRENTVFVSNKHVAKWVWVVLMALCAPELLCFIRCFHRTMFRNVKRPTFLQFFIVLIVESLNAYGVGALVFDVFINLPADTAVMLSNALCLIPSILTCLSRRPNRWLLCLAMLDMGAIASQSTIYWAWPAFVPEIRDKAVAICVYTSMVSLAWWQNFVHPHSFLAPIRRFAGFAGRLAEKRSKTYVLVSLWKCFIYIFCLAYFLSPRMSASDLFQMDIFGERLITITARNLNETEINSFQQRMHEYDTPDYKLPSKSKTFIEENEEDQEETTTKKWNPDEDPDVIDVGEYDKKNKKEAFKKKNKHKRDARKHPSAKRKRKKL